MWTVKEEIDFWKEMVMERNKEIEQLQQENKKLKLVVEMSDDGIELLKQENEHYRKVLEDTQQLVHKAIFSRYKNKLLYECHKQIENSLKS